MGFLLHRYKFLIIAFVIMIIAVVTFLFLNNQTTVEVPPKGVFV